MNANDRRFSLKSFILISLFSVAISSTSEKNNYNNPAGEIYVVAGTAGRSLYNLNSKASFVVNQFQGYGFLNLEMSDDGKTMTTAAAVVARKLK